MAVNARDRNRDTPLHLAASRGHTKLVCILPDYGANTTEKNIAGQTPLHFAAMMNHLDVVTILSEYIHASVEEDRQGYTSLHHAQL